MKISELIERLQEIAESYPEADVQMAVQPSYPLAETLRGVVGPDEELDMAEDLDEEAIARLETSEMKVWLVSGGQDYDAPYAPRWAFSAV